MVVRLVYETHSTTTDNETGIATGWLPGELSAQGILNAQALGRRRRDDGIDAVFCSDLHRAVQTAAIAFGGTGIPIIQDPRLRETNYGDLNGKPTAVVRDDGLAHLNEPFPNGESWRQAADRTVESLQDMAEQWDGKRIVVIAHSAQRYILRELFEGMPFETALTAPFEWQEGWEYTLSPSTLTNLRMEPVDNANDIAIQDWRQVHNLIIPADPLTMDEVRERVHHRLEVVYLNGVPIGCTTVRPPRTEGGTATVIVRVLPAHRRRGFGTTLFARALTQAQALGANEIETIIWAANADGLRFAQANGFEEVSRYQPADEDDIPFITLRLVRPPAPAPTALRPRYPSPGTAGP